MSLAKEFEQLERSKGIHVRYSNGWFHVFEDGAGVYVYRENIDKARQIYVSLRDHRYVSLLGRDAQAQKRK